MAHIDLAADISSESEVNALAGRVMGLGMAVVGSSGQAIGRKVDAGSGGYPKQTLKVGEMTVKGSGS